MGADSVPVRHLCYSAQTLVIEMLYFLPDVLLQCHEVAGPVRAVMCQRSAAVMLAEL
jgi:hypothetical protein